MGATRGPRRPILLAGRTAAVEWVSLLLRRTGREPLLLVPRAGGAEVRAAWGDGRARRFASARDAVVELGASALLADHDDREGRAAAEAAAGGSLPCPAVVISAFGRGPDAPRGSDLAVSAASGVLHLTGASRDPEGRPLPLHPHQTATIAGSLAATALLLAEGCGRPGQLAELTRRECFAICAAGEVTKWTYAGLVPSRLGSPLFQPSAVMRAGDGDLFVLCTSEEQWDRLAAAMGEPEWARWEIFGDRGLRARNWDVLEPRLGEWVAGRTRGELMAIALESRLPFALALAPAETGELAEELAGSAGVRDWLYRTTPGPAAPPSPRAAKGGPFVALRRPLDGVTVLDLSTVWATPLCAAQLAHLGARVIKVEVRARLDHSRARLGELSAADSHLPDHDRKGSFRETNQGKESVTLNLAADEGRRLLLGLARHADVVLSNFTPGVAERLGLSADALWGANPGLVIGRLSAYRPGSRLAPLTGFGYAMLLACGFGWQAAEDGAGAPWIDRSIAYPDPQAGFVLAFAIVDALRTRAAGGPGALIEVDLFGPSAAMHRYLGEGDGGGAPPEGRGFALPPPAFSEVLPCRHGEWVAVTCETAEEAARLPGALGAEEGGTGETPRALARRLGEASRRREAQQLEAALRGRGLAAQRVLDVRQLVREGGLTAAAHASTGLFRVPDGERHLHAASPWIVDGERLDAMRRAPRLGEHTASVLGGLLGLAPAGVAALESRRVAW